HGAKDRRDANRIDHHEQSDEGRDEQVRHQAQDCAGVPSSPAGGSTVHRATSWRPCSAPPHNEMVTIRPHCGSTFTDHCRVRSRLEPDDPASSAGNCAIWSAGIRSHDAIFASIISGASGGSASASLWFITQAYSPPFSCRCHTVVK